MPNDSITDDIRALRQQLAAQCGNDLATIFADVQRREASDGHVYVSLPPRRPRVAIESASPVLHGEQLTTDG